MLLSALGYLTVPIILLAKHTAAVDVISSTESTEFGAYVNPNPKNICEGEELEILTVCASEVLSKLDECKPDDLACECCALQSMKRDCYGLCPNTASGNFLAVLYDDCETMNDVNACNLPFKKHDSHIAQFLRPNSRVPVEEKEPDFVIKSVLNSTAEEEVQFGGANADNSTSLDLSYANFTNDTNTTRNETAAAVESNGAHSSVLQDVVNMFVISFAVILLI